MPDAQCPMPNENETATAPATNSSVFRDCVEGAIVKRSLGLSEPSKNRKKKVGMRRKIKTSGGRERAPTKKLDHDEEEEEDDLSEFAEYIAAEIFSSTPSDFQTLSYPLIQKSAPLASKYATDPLPETTLHSLFCILPPSVSDSLQTYALIPDSDPSSLSSFLTPIFTEYIAATTAPPPVWSRTRTSACEICERGWVPLTYHHLIPRETHAKVLKRGWHEEWRLNSVAWLCGACHRFVHGCASNEELAREWWSVERLMEREDVKAWARWRGSVRWKKK